MENEAENNIIDIDEENIAEIISNWTGVSSTTIK